MPIAEAVAAGPAAPARFLLPADAASALDLGTPLMHAPTPLHATAAVVEPQLVPHAPTPQPAAPAAAEPVPTDQPPVQRLDPSAAPVAIGGVTAATAIDLADRATGERTAELAHGPAPTWWSPANALVLAVAALTWQFISFYGREQLPGVKVSGAELRGFDSLVDMLPLATASAGRFVGVALAAAALSVVLYGTRRGLREPVLQGIVGGVAGLSLLMLVALPALVG